VSASYRPNLTFAEISMAKASLSLQSSEATVVQAAATIYSSYVISGRVSEGAEGEWLQRALREAIKIARMTDDVVHADSEIE
jgi:hypothetical protein